MRSLPRSIRLALLALLAAGRHPAAGADYRLQALETAHGLFRAATNEVLYAEAARQYEYLVVEERVRNGHLFYTLGNCWFLAGDTGRAILNYRRAERLLPNDPDLRHNLAAVLALRADLVAAPERHPLAERLLGWHFRTPARRRGWLFAACWICFWGAAAWARRTGRKEARLGAATAGLLAIVLLASLLAETWPGPKNPPGVILAAEVLARKGDGERYAPAFLDPLHAGTEFVRLQERGPWWHIRLADGQTCWIPAEAAGMVALPH